MLYIRHVQFIHTIQISLSCLCQPIPDLSVSLCLPLDPSIPTAISFSLFWFPGLVFTSVYRSPFQILQSCFIRHVPTVFLLNRPCPCNHHWFSVSCFIVHVPTVIYQSLILKDMSLQMSLAISVRLNRDKIKTPWPGDIIIFNGSMLILFDCFNIVVYLING